MGLPSSHGRQMKRTIMIGCAAIVGGVGFVIGLVFAMLLNDPNVPHPLLAGAITGGIAFVAALLLSSRDSSRFKSARQRVRDRLLARADVGDDEFCGGFPSCDTTLLLQTRDAVAAFFEVPPTRIHARDQFETDFESKSLGPTLPMSAVHHVLARRGVKLGSFSLTDDIGDLGDLAARIQGILDGLESQDDEDLES